MNYKYNKFKNFKSKNSPLHINLVIPNAVTLIGLCSGISALKFAINLNWNLALIAIFFSCLFDVMDGAIARMLKATSVFGAQLDSLSDFICFGVVPGFIIYIWANIEGNMIGWVAVLFYILSIVIRLARFNSDLINDSNKKIHSYYDNQSKTSENIIQNKKLPGMTFFKGVPAPASAMLVLLPLIISNEDGFNINFLNINKYLHNLMLPAWLVFISILAISKIPTLSLKNIKINKNYFSIIIVFVALTIIMLITYTWKVIPIILFFYIVSIFFTMIKYNKINYK